MKYATRLTARTGDSRITGAAPDRYKWSGPLAVQGASELNFAAAPIAPVLPVTQGAA